MKRHRLRAICSGLVLFAALIGAATSRANDPNPQSVPVKRSQLCVTEGALEALPDARLSVSVPKLRAVLAAPGSQAIEARFSYLGPTAEMASLRRRSSRGRYPLAPICRACDPKRG
jgi:hypothetical protein